MKEMKTIKNPLFNLYQNPYNPALMQTFWMMEKVPKLGKSWSAIPKMAILLLANYEIKVSQYFRASRNHSLKADEVEKINFF